MQVKSILRVESFGGTLFDIRSGKRVYLNKDEACKVVPYEHVQLENCSFTPPIKIVTPSVLPTGGFSFADTAFIEITRKCNLHCTHCLNNSGKELDNILTPKEINKVIDDLSRAGIQEIRFTGGEPLLHPNIFEFIYRANKNGIRTSIGTNATLITPYIAETLSKAGLKQAIVSIDGTEDAHDNIRGKGNYRKALQGIENLQKNGIMIRINSVLMKNNYKDIINLMREMNSKQLPVFIRRFIESGRGNNQFSQVLTKEDYDKVREELKKELEGRYIKGHYLSTGKVEPRIQLPFERRDCSAGQRGIVILPNGNIHTCGFLAAQGELALGNVREVENWTAFWNKLILDDPLKKLRRELQVYNSKSKVQPTTCLAYVAYKMKERP